jgi:hypothetical protein
VCAGSTVEHGEVEGGRAKCRQYHGNKAKTQTYCIADLIYELVETTEEGKTDEVLQKITVLVASLPEDSALVRDLQDTDINPKSQDGQEIGSILIALDKLCEGQQTRSESVVAAV